MSITPESFVRRVDELIAEKNHFKAENARLKAEVERSTAQYNSIIDHQLAVIEGKQAEIDRLNTELFTCSCANANMNKHMNENARLKAEVERLRKAGDWRPIETAPKDGKTVVLVVEYGYVYTGIFHNDGYCQDLYGAGLDPTNWMPLPNPPAKEGKQP